MIDARLSTPVLLAFGLSAMPLSALALGIFVFLPTVYAESVGIGMSTLGVVLLGSRVWDVVSDPLIGWLTDRTRTRFGRRRPWVLLAWAPLTVSIYALFVPPDGVGAVYLLIWSLVLFTTGTALFMPYTAWGAELSGVYHERSRVFAFRHVFAAAGTLLAAGLRLVADDGSTGSEAVTLELIAWVGLLMLPLTLLVLFVKVPEPPLPPRPRVRVDPGASARIMFGNRPFRRLLGAYFLNGIANAFPATLFLFFVTHVLGDPVMFGLPAAGVLLVAYFGAAIAGTPLWLWLARRFGKHRTWSVAMLLAALILILVPFVGEGDALGFLALVIMLGVTLGGDLTMPGAMQADVVDEDTVNTGEKRTGIYYAVWAMVAKLALAIAVGAGFPLLGLAGFVAGGVNTGVALVALVVLFSAVPVVFKLAAVVALRRYPLTEARQQELRAAIAAHDVG